jgi:peptidoglycan/LPS O-acetylase OafA/YrhL
VLKYRRDIDGLRAIAVVPVVIYHIARSFMPGGYVGVDIFFVISGYLISGNIFQEIEANRFSIARFYERRIRRIGPAYAAVLCFCAIVVFAKFYPGESIKFSASLLAAVLSVTNIYFWLTSGYFELASEEIPLLHTWSLSVEEQFYLIFPLFFVFIAKYGSRFTKTALQLTFAASLAVAAVGVFYYPVGTFYLLPTRAWELLLGTMLAIKSFPALQSSLQRNLSTALGLLLLGVPMLAYGTETPFPGIAAVPPCLGAALIIHAGESGDSIVSRILSLPPLVFVGMISYSLYLWHWPLLVFQKTDFLLIATDSKFLTRATILVASFAAATLSWWLIERPTRNRALVSSPVLISGVAVAACCVLAFVGLMYGAAGIPNRFSPEAIKVASYRDVGDTPHFRQSQCFLASDEPISVFDKPLCLPDDPNKKSIMLLGDSHAGALFFGMNKILPDYNVLQITGVRCAPLIVPQPDPGRACQDLMKIAVDQAARRGSRLTVLLVARWNRGEARPTTGWNLDWLGDLKKTVEKFRSFGTHVVVIGQMPEYQIALPRLLASAIEQNDPGLPRRLISGTSLTLDSVMRKYAEANGLEYISTRDIVCPDNKCMTYANSDVPLLLDIGHLSDPGSTLVAKAIMARLAFPAAMNGS